MKTEPRLSPSLRDALMAAGRGHTHCIYCGRALIEVEEWDYLCDPRTGERKRVVWKQCPRFARSWRNLWTGGGCHESFQRDDPIHSREWR